MNMQENFYADNYCILGALSKNRWGYGIKEEKELKNKLKEKGKYMLPIRKVAQNQMPTKADNNILNAVSYAVSSLDLEDQERIIELSKTIPEPEDLIDQTIAIQQYRIKMGLENEYQQGRLLQSTQEAINSIVNMITAKQNISEGQNINVNVNNTITSLLDELNDDDTVIDMDRINMNKQNNNMRF